MSSKFQTLDAAHQAIVEGIWMAGFATAALIGIEGYIAKDIGLSAINPLSLGLAAAFALVGVLLWRRVRFAGYLGMVCSVAHVAVDLNVMIIVMQVFVLYFMANAQRALNAYPVLQAAEDGSGEPSA